MARRAATCLLCLLTTLAWGADADDWNLQRRASYLFGYAQLGPAVEEGKMLPALVAAGIADAAAAAPAQVPVEAADELYRRWKAERDAIEGPGDDRVPGPDAAWSDRQKISYLFGYLPLTQAITESRLDAATVIAGLGDGFEGADPAVDPATREEVFSAWERQLQEERLRSAQAEIAATKRYLERTGELEGVTTTASGLRYEVLEPGEGPVPGPNDRVRVHYTGRLIDGTVFDSSEQRGEPAIFNVGGVIAGWTEALQLMKVGARYRLHLPPELGYGERGAPPDIPPGAVLVFEVSLLGIE